MKLIKELIAKGLFAVTAFVLMASPALSSTYQTVYGSSVITATFTRPADTTAYAASDVVCNSTSSPAVITFTNIAKEAGGNGYIMSARLNKSTTTTTNANFRLYLYTVAPTPIADNAAFTLLYANRASRIGWIDFSSMNTEGTGSDSANAYVTAAGVKFTCAADSRNLYGVLVAKAAYAPGNAEQFFIELGCDLN